MIFDHNIKKEDFPEGVIFLIHKPVGWTSFDVVNKIRGMLRHYYGIPKIKVGHAGTLDPLAEGLVIVATGKFTRRLTSLQDEDKEYVATLSLGAVTPSYDLETEISESVPTDHITHEMVHETIQYFVGEQDQMPPVFSAKWVDGKRAYQFARKGKDPQLSTSRITIYQITTEKIRIPEIILRIKCSKGTYIRSLAHDIGQRLGCGAYLSGLIRTKSGGFELKDAITMQETESAMKEVSELNRPGISNQSCDQK
jgi:tRNA pseudouridine55 synthase